MWQSWIENCVRRAMWKNDSWHVNISDCSAGWRRLVKLFPALIFQNKNIYMISRHCQFYLSFEWGRKLKCAWLASAYFYCLRAALRQSESRTSPRWRKLLSILTTETSTVIREAFWKTFTTASTRMWFSAVRYSSGQIRSWRSIIPCHGFNNATSAIPTRNRLPTPALSWMFSAKSCLMIRATTRRSFTRRCSSSCREFRRSTCRISTSACRERTTTPTAYISFRISWIISLNYCYKIQGKNLVIWIIPREFVVLFSCTILIFFLSKICAECWSFCNKIEQALRKLLKSS